MKEGWTYKKFGEVCSYHKEQGSFQNLPYVGMEHMESCTGKLLGTISSNSVLSSSFKFNKGEILYGRLRPYLKKVYVAEFDGCCSTEVFPINSDSIEPGFIKYWFLSDKITNMVNKTSAGCRMPRGNMNEVKNFLIGFPEDRKEQKRIVKRLDAVFENIDKLKANAEKQLAEARTLFQKSLAKAMKPKEGWEEKKLKDIAQVRIGPFGSLLHKKDYISGGIPLVNPIHMVNGNIVANNDYTISDVKAKELSNYLLKENDIVFARRGEVGRCAIVTGEDEGFLCGTGSLFVRFLREIDSNFMLMLFQSDYCKNYLEHNAFGATMLNINAGIVEDMPLTLPSLAEQQRIVERLDALSENIRKYEEIQRQIISECDALKQALLRKVFE